MLTINDVVHERYLVEKLIGRGGFGNVYRARDLAHPSQRVVALKCLHVEPGIPGRERIAFVDMRQELQLFRPLRHAAMARVYDMLRYRNAPVLVMEYVPGCSCDHLFDMMDRPGREDLVVSLGLTVCDVLDYLHHQQDKIILRDIKPANIMIYRRGRAHLHPEDLEEAEDLRFKLIDFGIARTYKPGKPDDTYRMGSEIYCSPEQQYGPQTDWRSDIYSLGVTMACLLAVQRPVNGVPRVQAYAPHVSGELLRIIRRATMVRPRDRYQSASEMYADLFRLVHPRARAVGERLPDIAPPRPLRQRVSKPTSEPFAKPRRPKRRPRRRVIWPAIAIAAAAAGATVTAAYVVVNSLPEESRELLEDTSSHPLYIPLPTQKRH